MKTLVLYIYHELNHRVNNFIKNAIFLDPDVDFIVINNGSEKEPILPDHVIYFKGDNNGYDFGGWSKGLLYNKFYQGYDYFIFVNSSASGPYLPRYHQERWTDIYINGLSNSIRLFGSSISTSNDHGVNDVENLAHVQSYIFSINKDTLIFLIHGEIFSLNNLARNANDLFINKEMRMSRLIIENKWNIGCLMTYYIGVDFRFLASKPSSYKPFLGDPMVSSNFSEKLFNNFYELVFVKGTHLEFNVHNLKL